MSVQRSTATWSARTPSPAYDASADSAAAAFEAPGALDAPCAVSYGPVPGSIYAGHRFIDVLIHGWDLASATGQPTDLDPQLVDACWDVVRPQLSTAAGQRHVRTLGPADGDRQSAVESAGGTRAHRADASLVRVRPDPARFAACQTSPTSDVATAAQALFQAELDNVPITPISETYPTADIADAYRISQAVTELKVAAGRVDQGSQDRPHVEGDALAHQRHRARLRHDVRQLVRAGGRIVPRSTMNRPLVEVELAFVLKEPFVGPGVNAADVIRATDFVLPAIEIVDTRQAGPRPQHADRQHLRCRRVRAGGARRPTRRS